MFHLPVNTLLFHHPFYSLYCKKLPSKVQGWEGTATKQIAIPQQQGAVKTSALGDPALVMTSSANCTGFGRLQDKASKL